MLAADTHTHTHNGTTSGAHIAETGMVFGFVQKVVLFSYFLFSGCGEAF